MKTVLVFAAVLALVACTEFPGHEDSHKILVDKAFIKKQLGLLRLFHRLGQHSLFQQEKDLGDKYDIEANIEHYKDPRVVKQFMSYYRKGMLQRHEHYSSSYAKHREQAILLFELFYFANDYDTFYKTACWARDRVNPGMFSFCLSIAILHREDTQDFALLPAYEVYPFYFVHEDVIQQAQQYWTKEYGTQHHEEHHIQANFTVRNEEDLVAYFREDINLNTFNLNYYFSYPIWFNGTLYGKKFDRSGEQYYYTQKQIYARYILERLSNDLGSIHPFSYNKPFKTAYNPALRFANGDEMPARPSNLFPSSFDLFYLSDIRNCEKRVVDAIESGYVFDQHMKGYDLYDEKHGMDILGHIVHGSYDSVNRPFYGGLFNYYRLLIGHITDPYHRNGLPPSALGHHATALRDPANYQLFKRLDHIVQKYKNRLPSYTHGELNFPGVKVENVDVGELYTFFESFDISLANALYLASRDDIPKANIYASQYRLNHKPFTYIIDVSSDKKQDVYVRVFLGPKYDRLGRERDLDDARHFYVELDRFPYHVDVGVTKIERHSKDSSIIASQQDSTRHIFNKLKDALDGKSQYYIDKSHKYCGYPENLLIPKGKKGGQLFTFYVMVTPYVKQDEHDFEPYNHKAFSYCGVGHGRKYPDDKPLGFPFDRRIYSYDFFTPNMHFQDVVIFFKKYEEVNASDH